MPYTLDADDMRFATPRGFDAGDHFLAKLRDSFGVRYAEGDPGFVRPKTMSIGMHRRMPGRIGALHRVVDHVAARERLRVCRRVDGTRHRKAGHPCR